jgi:hypothetical protein
MLFVPFTCLFGVSFERTPTTRSRRLRPTSRTVSLRVFLNADLFGVTWLALLANTAHNVGESKGESPMTARDVFRSKAFLAGTAQSVLWTALGVALVYKGPSFAKIFKDFSCNLPEMTIAVLKTSYTLTYYWHFALLPIIAWPFVNWGIVSVLSPRPEVVIPRRLWYFATWGVMLLTVVFTFVALFLPLIGEIQAISPPPVVPITPSR